MSCDKCGLRDKEDVIMHLKNLRKNFDACGDMVVLDSIHRRIQDLEWVLELE